MRGPVVLASAVVTALWCSGAYAQSCAVVLDANHVQFEGGTYRALDDEGVYYVDEASHGGVPFPTTHTSLADRIGERACVRPVRLELVDYVDCTKTDHGFEQSSSGQSRLLNLNGTTFRVTGSPSGFDLFYFAYHVATDPWPGRGHLLVVETINDQERYTGVAITHPRVGAWAPPYESEGVCPIAGREWWDCFDFCEEGDCFHPDVGVTVYTGQEYALDGQRFNIYQLFYPKMDQIKVTVSSSGWYKNRNANSGGAASRIWVYKVSDPIADRLPAIEPPETGPERRVGIYMTHPWYFYGHYGVPARTVAQRQQSLSIMLDTLAFCGFNWVEFNAINGSDRSGFSWYDSSYFPSLGGDLLAELPPLAQQKGIGVVPVITSLLIPGSHSGLPPTPPGWSFTNDSFQRLTDGTSYTMAFNARTPDPLRPEVQDWLLYFIDEIAAQVVDHDSVKGLGFRANGKIGLCYQSHQDGWKGAKESGYSTWNVQQYKNATGSGVPTTAGQAYSWLRARPAEWNAWIDFRCGRTRDFWLRARDRVKSWNPDWNLYVKIVLPSEVPGTNIEWVNEGFTPTQLLKHHGYDPALFTNETGIVIERTMMVDENRFYTSVRWAAPWGANDYAFKDFHFRPELPQTIRTAEGSALELYHNYWEEAFHPDFEFGTDLRTNTATGPGRAFYEPVTFSLRHANVDTISFMGWERPILDHEHDLRAFSAAFRALPLADPVPFDGTVNPNLPEVAVRWYGDRLALLNDAQSARTVTLAFATPVPNEMDVYDVASGIVYLGSGATPRTGIAVPMEGWSLRTLAFEYVGPPPTATPTDTGPTRTPTDTPTSPPPPTPTQLLANPGFEADAAPWIFPPMSWSGWGDDNPDGTTPEGRYHPDSFHFLPHGGSYGCGKTTNWGSTTSAGVYQRVAVASGSRYACTAYGYTPKEPSSDGSVAYGQVRLGVDPLGGTNRAAAGVLWTAWSSHPTGWQQIGFSGENAIVAQAGYLTLFLEYRQTVSTGWNGMFFDDALVQLESPAVTETPTSTNPPSSTATPTDTPGVVVTNTPTSTGTPTNTPLVTATATSTSAQTPCVVALANPGYEAGLVGWTAFQAAGKAGGTARLDPDTHIPSPANAEGSHRAGTSYGGLGNDAGGGLYQEICVVPGQRYEVSLQGTIVSSSPVNDGGNDALGLYWIDGTGADFTSGLPAAAELLDGIVSNTAAWTELAGTIQPTADHVTLIVFWSFGGVEWVVNACHVDDWRIAEAPPVPTPNAVSAWSVY